MRGDSVPAVVRRCSFLPPAPSSTPHLKIIVGGKLLWNYYFQDFELSEKPNFKFTTLITQSNLRTGVIVAEHVPTQTAGSLLSYKRAKTTFYYRHLASLTTLWALASFHWPFLWWLSMEVWTWSTLPHSTFLDSSCPSKCQIYWALWWYRPLSVMNRTGQQMKNVGQLQSLMHSNSCLSGENFSQQTDLRSHCHLPVVA